MELFVHDPQHGAVHTLRCAPSACVAQLKRSVAALTAVPMDALRLRVASLVLADDSAPLSNYRLESGASVHVSLRLLGGMDFQNRVGSKPGAGGVASESQANVDRRERLRKLALETVDISKDPYFMKNHLGSYECKLCLTLHNNEGNYLAHTQGKRHQTNLARRAAKEAADASQATSLASFMAAKAAAAAAAARPRPLRIGLPGYKVVKQRDPDTGARMLLFQIEYPEHDAALQPRHRFMSSFEQKVETPDKAFQYLLFACEPYETVAFKIPNLPLDKRDGKFFSNWDKHGKSFTLQLTFLPEEDPTADGGKPAPPPVPPPRR
ncbi:hypothetical protein P43SY_007664 [Pythium insidiosum]|uniref:Splicing factor 3A subunit n=1 Tax=Pythium insidiosum TaxID=114742 RepID=A0AAD5Q8H9_PYTIN|nr:hypothetical protein P43SY_007664 [Pythium insidiosum]KAJ0410088.1 hypothetical protein ATCC90586_004938 [Pythium insidiosum]